jgi:hypothetical protein
MNHFLRSSIYYFSSMKEEGKHKPYLQHFQELQYHSIKAAASVAASVFALGRRCTN